MSTRKTPTRQAGADELALPAEAKNTRQRTTADELRTALISATNAGFDLAALLEALAHRVSNMQDSREPPTEQELNFLLRTVMLAKRNAQQLAEDAFSVG